MHYYCLASDGIYTQVLDPEQRSGTYRYVQLIRGLYQAASETQTDARCIYNDAVFPTDYSDFFYASYILLHEFDTAFQ